MALPDAQAGSGVRRRLLLASLLLARMVSIATAQTRTPHSAATCTLRRTSSQNPMDWRKDAIRAVRDECSRALASGAYDCKDRDMYQFGIFGGKSVKSLLFYSNCSRTPLRRFFGFDSFRGLVRKPDSNPRPFALLELEFLCPSSLQSAEGRTFESHSGSQTKTGRISSEA